MIDERPYWAATPRQPTLDRLDRLASIVSEHGEPMTVRAITYKLYPDAHGQDLTKDYNKTCKDAVRARVLGLVPWDSIKEGRVESGGQRLGDGDPSAYLDRCLDADRIAADYHVDRTEAHRVPIEVWFEKATVVDDFEDVCGPLDARYVCTRGQSPWTTKRQASQRLSGDARILYFGDNDEKGREIANVIDRDLRYLAAETDGDDGAPTVEWCGVTEEHEARFGLPAGARLDGLDPADLRSIIEESVGRYIDQDALDNLAERETDARNPIRATLDGLLGDETGGDRR